MKRQIIIDSDARKRLQEAFGVTRVTVWKALKRQRIGPENPLYGQKGNGRRGNKRFASGF